VQSIAAAEERFTASMTRMMIASAVLGLLVALASVARVRVLESRSHQHRRLTEEAEQKMRKLSQQVVRAQEDERRSISRELHDEVGQMLTGLRMELRGLLRMQEAPAAEFQRQVEQARTVVDQTLQSIRDIAMGLRPSMLDDLGLDAALRWQAREFCRRHDIPVTVEINADLSHLPEQHRTNLYRIVQEGLTNCARHAQARSVTVHIDRTDSELTVSVIDDGIGAVNGARSAGLGLIGIQERARELGGTADLRSRRPAAGTALTVTVPVAWKESYVESSSAACG
jgi:signal transduction histidine kinase